MKKDEALTQSKMMQLLDWSYETAINGLPGMESAEDLAKEYLRKSDSVEEAIDKFIGWQCAKCGTSGFVTGLGGLLTLPVAIPANIASVLLIQIRMVAAIAYMRGYNIRDDEVKALVYIALTGQSAADLLKRIGINMGSKMTNQLIKKVPFQVIKQINQRVGFRLITKSGQTGVINLTKWIPLVGGIIGGTVDALGTVTIGKIAKEIFAK